MKLRNRLLPFVIVFSAVPHLYAAESRDPAATNAPITVEYTITGPVTRVQMPPLTAVPARRVRVGPTELGGMSCESELIDANTGYRMKLEPAALKDQLAMTIARLVETGGPERLAQQVQLIENESNETRKIMLAFRGSTFNASATRDFGNLNVDLDFHQIAQLQMGQEVTLTADKCRTREQRDALVVEALRVMRLVHQQLTALSAPPQQSGTTSPPPATQRQRRAQ